MRQPTSFKLLELSPKLLIEQLRILIDNLSGYIFSGYKIKFQKKIFNFTHSLKQPTKISEEIFEALVSLAIFKKILSVQL